MADDQTTTETEVEENETEDSEKEISPEAFKKMQAALHKANKEAEKSRLQLKEIQDAQKSESEKASDRATVAEKEAETAKQEAARLRVALRKGLTETQARRLVGDSEEELEADAEELVASFKDGSTKPSDSKPKENLKSGTDPEEESVDGKALAKSILEDTL